MARVARLLSRGDHRATPPAAAHCDGDNSGMADQTSTDRGLVRGLTVLGGAVVVAAAAAFK